MASGVVGGAAGPRHKPSHRQALTSLAVTPSSPLASPTGTTPLAGGGLRGPLPPPAPPGAVAGVRPKTRNERHQRLKGCLNHRLAYTQISVLQVLFVCLFVLVLGLITGLGDKRTAGHTKLGSLAASLSLIIVLPATRNGVLGWLLDMPFERMITYHRWTGRLLLGVLTMHMIWAWTFWTNNGQSIGTQMFGDSNNLWGFIGWCVAVVMNILSLDYFRRRHFEVFYWTHFIFILYYIAGAIHRPAMGPYVYAAIALYGLDRFIRLFWGMMPVAAVSVTKFNDITMIRFPKHTVAKTLKLYKVGQYVFVNFPQLSWLEWHPFSVASGPDELSAQIYVRGLGNYTKKLLEHIKPDGSQKLLMRIDGPYGNHRLNYRRFPVVMLMAGGIGITPMLGIIKDIFRLGDLGHSDRRSARSSGAAHCIEALYMVWVIPNEKMWDWFKAEFEAAWTVSNEPGMPVFNMWVYVTRGGKVTNPICVAGRPNFPAIFNQVATERPQRPMQVFACGPELMVNAGWDASTALNRAGHRVDFHHETFEF